MYKRQRTSEQRIKSKKIRTNEAKETGTVKVGKEAVKNFLSLPLACKKVSLSLPDEALLTKLLKQFFNPSTQIKSRHLHLQFFIWTLETPRVHCPPIVSVCMVDTLFVSLYIYYIALR